MSQTISIAVAQKQATTDFTDLVSHNSAYELSFTFDGEWAEYEHKTVVVKWEGGGVEQPMVGNGCRLPAIGEADEVKIGVYAIKGEERIASTFVTLACIEGAKYIPMLSPEGRTFPEEVLRILNERDWSIFEDKVEEGLCSAVYVNSQGVVTAKMNSTEINEQGGSPSSRLLSGGLFFRKVAGGYRLYKNALNLSELVLRSVRLPNPLVVGEKAFDGANEVHLDKSDIGLSDVPNYNPYPIGAVYISSLPTSPAQLFGGSWAQIKDCFLLAAGDSYAAASEGGEATHTLTNTEIPKHYHFVEDADTHGFIGRGAGAGVSGYQASMSSTGNVGAILQTRTSGGDGAHNNMPPYLTFYMWQRVF